MRIPWVIAEAGSTHEESFTRALELIEIAKRADADAIKFQLWTSPARMRERRHMTDLTAYEVGSIKITWLPLLSDKAHEVGLEFMTTAYLPEDIEVVAPYVDRFKVASFEAGDKAFYLSHFDYAKEVIVSTGMMTPEDEAELYFGEPFMRARHLHCISGYPIRLEEANLAVLGSLAYHGYSDHTRFVHTGGLAVVAGADILEVHFRLDDTSSDCPDYPVALSPWELNQYIAFARLAHTMRGDGVKKPQSSEIPNMKHRVQP